MEETMEEEKERYGIKAEERRGDGRNERYKIK